MNSKNLKEENSSICTQGQCWDGYIYVGPKPGVKGSCIKKEKLCKKNGGKGFECIKNGKVNCNTMSIKSDEFEKDMNEPEYKKCLKEAEQRRKQGNLKLCPRGYCTAKTRFQVYPSAYANGYAVGVCMGNKKDAEDKIKSDPVYMARISKLSKKSEKKSNDLNRWYREKWVNLCEKDKNGPGGFAVCGSGDGIENPQKYPYCRAYYRRPGTTVVTAQELQKYFPEYIEKMCKEKRSKEQGIDGKPTRIRLPKYIYEKIKKIREQEVRQTGGGDYIKIPSDVRKTAELGIKLLDMGYLGGTQTGWDRAKQLAFNEFIDIYSLADMRTWFARHGPDASNGGTSYPGYCSWIKNGKPINKENTENYRGAVSWLIWGGDAAYKWLKTLKVRTILEKDFPNRKASSIVNNLGC